jgi:hypothetical protein
MARRVRGIQTVLAFVLTLTTRRLTIAGIEPIGARRQPENVRVSRQLHLETAD